MPGRLIACVASALAMGCAARPTPPRPADIPPPAFVISPAGMWANVIRSALTGPDDAVALQAEIARVVGRAMGVEMPGRHREVRFDGEPAPAPHDAAGCDEQLSVKRLRLWQQGPGFGRLALVWCTPEGANVEDWARWLTLVVADEGGRCRRHGALLMCETRRACATLDVPELALLVWRPATAGCAAPEP